MWLKLLTNLRDGHHLRCLCLVHVHLEEMCVVEGCGKVGTLTSSITVCAISTLKVDKYSEAGHHFR